MSIALSPYGYWKLLYVKLIYAAKSSGNSFAIGLLSYIQLGWTFLLSSPLENHCQSRIGQWLSHLQFCNCQNLYFLCGSKICILSQPLHTDIFSLYREAHHSCTSVLEGIKDRNIWFPYPEKGRHSLEGGALLLGCLLALWKKKEERKGGGTTIRQLSGA